MEAAGPLLAVSPMMSINRTSTRPQFLNGEWLFSTLRGPNSKYATPVSGRPQQLVSRIGPPDPPHRAKVQTSLAPPARPPAACCWPSWSWAAKRWCSGPVLPASDGWVGPAPETSVQWPVELAHDCACAQAPRARLTAAVGITHRRLRLSDLTWVQDSSAAEGGCGRATGSPPAVRVAAWPVMQCRPGVHSSSFPDRFLCTVPRRSLRWSKAAGTGQQSAGGSGGRCPEVESRATPPQPLRHPPLVATCGPQGKAVF